MSQNLPYTLLSDYAPPEFLIPNTELVFDLGSDCTKVCAKLRVVANPDSTVANKGIVLNAEELDISQISINGQILDASSYEYTNNQLWLKHFPAEGGFVECEHTVNPEKNHALSGLYVSNGLLCTQCEPEGFRRISCFLDRPDVLSQFTVTLIAEEKHYPVLLSNGNLISRKKLPDGKIEAVWNDPHPKPSYLFALVAGELESKKTIYKPHQPKPGVIDEVELIVYASKDNIARADYALHALSKAMRWDEETFGRYCDLKHYILVAVDDFNSGAMENKGLNIFNSSYILADNRTATDEDFATIDAVVAHEYFHNWTGNRITCRDWFQLSLKEGLTVFRENLYMHDVYSSCMRVVGIRHLITSQFPEDAGPTAHPVQPGHYRQISNFYTSTIYEKGAEIIGMLYRLIGKEDFLQGMNAYFDRFDGQAVTIQDLLKILIEHSRFADRADVMLEQFNLWYQQKGTPKLFASYRYDSAQKNIILDLRQESPEVLKSNADRLSADQDDSGAGQSWSAPPIPVTLSVVDKEGKTTPANIEDDNFNPDTHTYVLSEKSCQLILRNASEGAIPVILEGFSAPVVLHAPYTTEDLNHLALYSQDHYTRWQVIQYIALREMTPVYLNEDQTSEELDMGSGTILSSIVGKLCQEAITATQLHKPMEKQDFCLLAEYLTLPSERYILTKITPSDPAANRLRWRWCMRHIMRVNHPTFIKLYDICIELLRNSDDQHTCQHVCKMALRRLANRALSYLCQAEEYDILPLDRMRAQYDTGNLTQMMGVLSTINSISCPLREELLERFHQSVGGNLQLQEKYLCLIATSGLDATEKIRHLIDSGNTSKFDIHNPNQVHSLIYAYCRQNPASLHARDGSGYRLIADCVLKIDEFNPHLSARLATVFSTCGFLVTPLHKQINNTLAQIAEHKLSPPLAEIIENCSKSS